MKKLLLALLYFSIHGSTAAEKNIEALRKYIPGEPGTYFEIDRNYFTQSHFFKSFLTKPFY